MFYSTYDATKSWYGYEYQGKLAIKKTLEYILKEIIEKNLKNFEELEESLSEIELEIENNEDFALLERKNYKSIHQVKTGAVDSEAINNMFFCYLEKNKNIDIYLHYTSGVYDYNKSIEVFKKKIKENLEELEKYFSGELDKNKINLDKKVKKKHSLEQALLILGTTKENLEENLNKIKKNLLFFEKEKINEKKFIFKKEEYFNVDLEIKKIIEEILKKINIKFSEIDEMIICKTLNMCFVLDEYLEKIVVEKKNTPIPFLKIIEILKKDDLKLPESYESYSKIERIINHLNDGCREKEICGEENCNTSCSVKEVLKQLREIRGENLIKFIKKINFPYGLKDIGESNLDKLLERLIEQPLKLEENNFYVKEKIECGTLDTREKKHEKRYIREFDNNRKIYNELLREKKIFLTENLEIENILNRSSDYSQVGYENDSRDILNEKEILITTYRERLK